MRWRYDPETVLTESSSRAHHQKIQATKGLIIAAWLIILYPVLIWFVIGTIGGYLFQEKIRRTGDQSLSVPTVMRVAIDLKTIRNDEAVLEQQIHEVQQQLRLVEKQETSLLDQALEDVQDSASAQAEAAAPRHEREQKLAGVQSAKEQMRKVLMTYNDRLKAILAEERALFQERGGNGTAISDVITELQYIEKARLNIFAIMPNQFLTLLLAMSMGALGSLIYITLDYFRDTASVRPVSWYLFRPFLGMVTAIAIFILAKAGQITISNVHAAGDFEENLNPFLISFLAIISGLLSEQAVEKIRTTGSAVFRTPSLSPAGTPEIAQRKRWAVGLQEAMKTQGKTAAALAAHTGVPLQTIENWIIEKEPVPVAAQQVIAAWLDTPRRSLFTDIAPSSDDSRAETKNDLDATDNPNSTDTSQSS